MAIVSFPTTDNKAVQQWSEGTEAEVLKKVFWLYFVGKSSEYLLQWKSELSDAPGDTITYALRMQLTDAPRTSGETLEGNERSLVYHDRSIIIDEMVDAVRFDNRMSRQRVAFDIRSDARDALADQLSNALDNSFFNQIAGRNVTPALTSTFRGNNSVTRSEVTHRVMAGTSNVNDDDLASGDNFTLALIDQALEIAKTATPAIRPAKLDFLSGGYGYVVFIHPAQMTQLRAAGTQFEGVVRDALRGGALKDNPLFTGNTIIWNGCLLVESSRVPRGINNSTGADVADTRIAIFCGAQTAAIGWGRPKGSENRFSWVERTFEYDREYGVSAGCLVGLQKNIFDSLDFACITISSFSADA